MLLQVGPLQFDVAPFNAHEIAHEAATEFAKKPVVGRRKIYEWVGEDEEKLKIKGKLFPFKIGGLGSLQLMQTLRQSGAPQYVVRGDGTVLGWYNIMECNTIDKHLSVDGIGEEIEVETVLERADSPGAAASFFNIFGLAP